MKKKVVVVMPAYNAARTLEMTYNDINRHIVNDVLVVDDYSRDNTVKEAKRLGIKVIAHTKNMGPGANQKTCFKGALKMGADIIVVIHADYQYCPKHLDKMVDLLENGDADVVLGSRILGGHALGGGMPIYKFLANKFLSSIQNLAYGLNLSDYATGYKAFTREVIEGIPFQLNSNGFMFDEELNTQVVHFGFKLKQIPIPTRYFAEASSVNFATSLRYGIETLWVLIKWSLHRTGIVKFKIFCKNSNTYQN